MEILFAVIFALFGIAVGSFLNVCIDRLPAGGSLVNPPSHCDACRRRLSPLDLIPVFSYLWLRGRCRYCGATIPRRVLVVELLSGVVFVLAVLRFGLSTEFAFTVFWCSVFLVIMFIDWEQKLILNKVTYPMAVLALVLMAVDSFLERPGIFSNLILIPQPSILSSVIGGAIGFTFFLVVYVLVSLIRGGGFGEGDIKMAGLIGLVMGFPIGIVALFIGIFIGGLVAIILLLLGIKSRKDVVPYGTFLGIGPIITLLWGREIVIWYLGFI